MGLIRLATYAIVGYAAYSIFRDVMGAQSESMMGRGERGQRQGRGRSEFGGGRESGRPMTGPAAFEGGRVEQTQGTDGGSTPHRVGRGVVGP